MERKKRKHHAKPEQPAKTREINWFEERVGVIILSLCEAIGTVQHHPEFQGHLLTLRQALFDALRLYRLCTRKNSPPSMRAWMLGDAEQDLAETMLAFRELVESPGQSVSWLETQERLSGVISPEEWDQRLKKGAKNRKH
jgi:hypothetical protein